MNNDKKEKTIPLGIYIVLGVVLVYALGYVMFITFDDIIVTFAICAVFYIAFVLFGYSVTAPEVVPAPKKKKRHDSRAMADPRLQGSAPRTGVVFDGNVMPVAA